VSDLLLTKTMAGLAPADQTTADYLSKVKLGSILHGSFVKARNPAFMRKYFALLNTTYEMWEPGEVTSKHGAPEKNFDRFREDLTIMAGYYKVVVRVDGSTRIEAKSISFAKMSEDEFEALYQNTITVILKHILTKYTREDVDDMVQRVLNFG